MKKVIATAALIGAMCSLGFSEEDFDETIQLKESTVSVVDEASQEEKYLDKDIVDSLQEKKVREEYYVDENASRFLNPEPPKKDIAKPVKTDDKKKSESGTKAVPENEPKKVIPEPEKKEPETKKPEEKTVPKKMDNQKPATDDKTETKQDEKKPEQKKSAPVKKTDNKKKLPSKKKEAASKDDKNVKQEAPQQKKAAEPKKGEIPAEKPLKKNDMVTPKQNEVEIPKAAEEKQEIPAPAIEAKKNISRSVQMQCNQYLDVIYPGTGWIYLGEEEGTAMMRYFGRKIGSKDTAFSLRSRTEGKTILHFYKNDPLTGNLIDDYLEVEIKGINTTNQKVTAPSYEAVVPLQEQRKWTVTDIRENPPASESSGNGALQPEKKNSGNTETKKSAAPKKESEYGISTVIQNSETIEDKIPAANEGNPDEKVVVSEDTENLEADKVLELAQNAFNSKEYAKTLEYLDDFFKKATGRLDEALFLQGQTLESNSEVRNIRKALDIYETIVRQYHQSINWAKANERVTYLRRQYIYIR